MLVEQHATKLYRLAAAIVGEADAQDLAQEAFTTAWRQLPRLREPDRFGAWLRRICVNGCRNHLRANRSAPISLETAHAELLPDGRRDFRETIHARDMLAPAFERLSADQRVVLSLHYMSGLSIAETAEAMGVRAGTAKSRLSAALAVLRLVLGSSTAPTPSEAEVAS